MESYSKPNNQRNYNNQKQSQYQPRNNNTRDNYFEQDDDTWSQSTKSHTSYNSKTTTAYSKQSGASGAQKGYQNKNQLHQGTTNFPKGPQKSNASQQQSKAPTQVKLYTNQFKVNVTKNLSVYQYETQISPDVDENSLWLQVLGSARKSLYIAMGLFLESGRTIFTPQDLEEDIIVNTQHEGNDYVIRIVSDTKVFFTDKFLKSTKMEEHAVMHTVLNNIIKQAFRGMGNLTQMGRGSKFIDRDSQSNFGSMVAYNGYKASTFNYQNAITVVLDSANRFVQSQSSLQTLKKLEAQYKGDQKAFQDKVKEVFIGQSLVTTWGSYRAYQIKSIIFDKTPFTMKFTNSEGDTFTVAQYFQKVIKQNITDKNQPIFVASLNGRDIYLPPELCNMDGIPDEISQDPYQMKEIMSKFRKNPNQKYDEIEKFSSKLFAQKQLKQWGLEIEKKPMELTSNILPVPRIRMNDGAIINCGPNEIRNLPIQNSVALGDDEWIFAYDQKNFRQAENVHQQMLAGCDKLGMLVGHPIWIEIQNTRDKKEFEVELDKVLKTKFKEEPPKIIVILVPTDRIYKDFKAVCYQRKLRSQAISYKVANKCNLSVASNILRQINSKLQGDLFNLVFPKQITDKHTMLLGIDVGHSGPNSVVGFCATYNREMSQYYSEKIVQRKNIELVSKNLTSALKNALSAYQDHNGRLPEHLILFRDGVGDSMRKQVLRTEISQFRQAINENYNQTEKKPYITVIFVNKRINQRFFVEDYQQNLQNPPPGCLIDSSVVESEDSNLEYDFYLIPQQTTQGCAVPTHFFVGFNDSPHSKDVIEKLTYDLCYYYFNWQGPIKVPAPCMYAHKIAELFMLLGDKVNTKMFDATMQESLHFL
uniref:Otiwi9 n=1 Tax=Oxytricha trifallax TaxID=94289 RepID=H2DHA2_OXYTR|nr:Otiwi9 [Sterkiella histriomuscorum]